MSTDTKRSGKQEQKHLGKKIRKGNFGQAKPPVRGKSELQIVCESRVGCSQLPLAKARVAKLP